MASLQVQLIDQFREYVGVDPINHALLVTSVDAPGAGGGSYYVDNGVSFTATLNDKITKNTSEYVRLVPTADNHVTVTFVTTEATLLSMYEGPTVTTDTAMTTTNRNLTSANSATMTATEVTALGATGTILWSVLSVNQDTVMTKFILESGTEYLLRLEDVSGLGGRFSVEVNWFDPS